MINSSDRGRTRRKNDPWEALVVAGLFFFPGVAMLFQHGTLIAFQQSFYAPSGFMVLSEHGAHMFDAFAIAVSLVIVWFYFYLRRAIARDEETLQKPHWR
jgi:hypothetical protein